MSFLKGLFATGDVLAQVFFPTESEQTDAKLSHESPASTSESRPVYQFDRTFRAALYGSFIFAPIGVNWYKLLTKINVRKATAANKDIPNVITRVAADQFIWTPVGIPLYFTCMGLMEGKSTDEVKLSLDQKYLPTLFTNWTVWIPVQTINFMFNPPQYRLLTVNVVSIFWNCFLSYTNSARGGANAVTEKEEKVTSHLPSVPN